MNRLFEASLGLLVLLLFTLFAYLLVFTHQTDTTRNVKYTAIFRKVDGLRTGDDVRIGGVKIGVVSNIVVDPQSYEILTTVSIDKEYALTTNASARILTDGLLGGSYVDLNAGYGPILEAEGYIENTNDALNLTELLGQLIFNQASER